MAYKKCTYADAVATIDNRVLCNNIHEIDEYAFENMSDNYYDEEPTPDIYQYFLTDCDQSQVERLEKKYNLIFMYSEKLDIYVLCVPHYGTAWSGVDWTECVDEE